ncbi:MAG: RNA-binding protein [Acidobacteriota bacterium]
MSYRIYVGNLSYQATEKDLEELFAGEGAKVESTKIISDFNTGKSRGFGFVEVSSREELERQVKRLNGYLFKGRNLVVSEAKGEKNSAKIKSMSQSARRQGG